MRIVYVSESAHYFRYRLFAYDVLITLTIRIPSHLKFNLKKKYLVYLLKTFFYPESKVNYWYI